MTESLTSSPVAEGKGNHVHAHCADRVRYEIKDLPAVNSRGESNLRRSGRETMPADARQTYAANVEELAICEDPDILRGSASHSSSCQAGERESRMCSRRGLVHKLAREKGRKRNTEKRTGYSWFNTLHRVQTCFGFA